MDLALLLLQAVCPAIRRELFPNSFVDIAIKVIEQDGSVLAGTIIAASTALILAGIEMLDSVVACSAVLAPNGEVFLTNPTRREESMSQTQFTVAFMPNRNQMTQVHLTGSVTNHVLNDAIALGAEGARAIYDDAVKPILEAFVTSS